MGQKVFPRALRSQKLLSGASFYSEHFYFPIWAKLNQLVDSVLSFSQRNLRYKNLRKWAKRPIKRRKLPTFLPANVMVSSANQTYKISPILFKFAVKSESHKYNPIKALYKIRRQEKRVHFRKKSRSFKRKTE